MSKKVVFGEAFFDAALMALRMCGRFSLFTPGDALARRFGVVEVPVYAPRYNIAPTQDVVVVRAQPEGTGPAGSEEIAPKRAAWMRWGVETPGRQSGARTLVINARAESAPDRPLFREAFRSRRCLVPADGFFEWKGEPSGRQPYWFTVKDGGPFAMAGLWFPVASDQVRTTSGTQVEGEMVILTTDSNPMVEPVHDRMPVILVPGEEPRWLDPEASPDELEAMMRPHPEGRMRTRRVSRSVNDATKEGAGLIKPDAQKRLF